MRGVGVVVVVVLTSVFAVSRNASAGAFLQAEGEALVITSSRFSTSLQTFDARGRLIPVSYYQKFQLATYVEYGATEWLTLVLEPTIAKITSEGPPLATYYGLESIAAGGRVRLGRNGDAIFSAQATVQIAGSRNRANPALIGLTGNEFDARVLAGVPFEVGGYSGFAEAQLGYRVRGGGPPNEIRLDLTVGIRPFERLLLMAQSFNIVAPSAGQNGFPAMRQHKVQASAVWDFNKSYSIHAAAFTTIASRNARREHGFVSGVWYRF